MSAWTYSQSLILQGSAGHTAYQSMQSAASFIMSAWTYMAASLLQGSVDHTTCEYQMLIDEAPDTIIPARPFTVHDRVYDAGDPLGGNFCPYNSSTPLQPCKKVPPCPRRLLSQIRHQQHHRYNLHVSSPCCALPHSRHCCKSLFFASPVVPLSFG